MWQSLRHTLYRLRYAFSCRVSSKCIPLKPSNRVSVRQCFPFRVAQSLQRVLPLVPTVLLSEWVQYRAVVYLSSQHLTVCYFLYPSLSLSLAFACVWYLARTHTHLYVHVVPEQMQYSLHCLRPSSHSGAHRMVCLHLKSFPRPSARRSVTPQMQHIFPQSGVENMPSMTAPLPQLKISLSCLWKSIRLLFFVWFIHFYLFWECQSISTTKRTPDINVTLTLEGKQK